MHLRPTGSKVRTMSGLAEALSLSTLVAGTLEYAILMRHREDRRQASRHDELAATLGHQALMRMRLLERTRPVRSWASFGTRFR
jgi:hypothetical protein